MDVSVTYLNYTSNYITLNYSSNYSLHHKLFGCIVCTLNYNSRYTLHSVVSFTIKLDENMKHMTCMFVT